MTKALGRARARRAGARREICKRFVFFLCRLLTSLRKYCTFGVNSQPGFRIMRISTQTPHSNIRVALWENSLRFFTRGLRIFGADRFQLKLKKSCDMRYFSSIRNFAQHCEFCCAKITYNVIFSSFFAQQNSHRGLKRNQ